MDLFIIQKVVHNGSQNKCMFKYKKYRKNIIMTLYLNQRM